MKNKEKCRNQKKQQTVLNSLTKTDLEDFPSKDARKIFPFGVLFMQHVLKTYYVHVTGLRAKAPTSL